MKKFLTKTIEAIIIFTIGLIGIAVAAAANVALIVGVVKLVKWAWAG